MALKRIAGGGLINAIRGLEGYLGGNVQPEDVAGIQEYLQARGIHQPSHVNPEVGRRSASWQSLLGLKNTDLEPESFGEKLLQDAVSTGVGVLLGGKPSLRTIKPIGAGFAASKAAEAAGLPEEVQNIANLAAEFKTRKSLLGKEGKLARATDKRNAREQHAENLYEQLPGKLKPKEKGAGAPSLKEFIHEVDNLHKTEIDRDAIVDLDKIAENIRGAMDQQGNIDILDAYKIKKSINNKYDKASDSLKPYLSQARKALESTLINHSAINPEFVRTLQEAQGLYSFNKENKIIQDFLESSGKGKSGIIKSAVKALKFIPRALTNQWANKYYRDMLSAIIKDDKTQAIRAASKFAKETLPYEEELDTEQSYNGWQLVGEPAEVTNSYDGWAPVE